MSDIPEWAELRAIQLTREVTAKEGPLASAMQTAFARYIAAHEEAPPDPLLIEARQIVALQYEQDHPRADHLAESSRNGEFDHHFAHLVTLRALKRGIEIGQGK